MAEKKLPWAFLEEYRGKAFNGEWPTLPEMFKIVSEKFAERNCFTCFAPDRITLTYRQVAQKVEKLSQWILSKGIKKGDRIAVTGANSPEWATVFISALFAGAVIVPIDHGLNVKQVQNLLNASKPKMFFVDDDKYDFFKENSSDMGILSIGKKDPEKYVYTLSTEKKFTAELPEENDLCAILFTSGTTGNPKGVMLSHKNLVSDCYIAQTRLTLYPTDVFYALLPIHHTYTMQAAFFCPLSQGCEIVFGKTIAVSKMLKELKEGKITLMLGVPLLYNKVMNGILKGIREKGPFVNGLMHCLMGLSYTMKKVFNINPGKKLFKSVLDKVGLTNLRIAISGGGPLAPSVFKRYNQIGIDFVQGYGLTETSPIIALNPIDNFKIESVGQYFFPYSEMKIIDADERGIGEVVVKGPMVMQGYYNMPEETAKVFTEDGFLKTGDLGRLDDEGYLYLAGRAKNLIVTEGGKNVFPEEIENMFQLENDVSQITVQGFIKDEKNKSEAVEALIYPSDDLYAKIAKKRGEPEADAEAKVLITQIVDKINRDLKPYARIERITMLDKPLEMTTSQKVKRTYKK